jgi:hypothetical protein
MSEDTDKVFPGFWDPRLHDGWTKMPHKLIDEVLCKIDSITELKVVLYILRNTWGYKEKKKTVQDEDEDEYEDEGKEYDIYKKITTDEFMHGRKRVDGSRIDKGTGLSDWGVKDGIAKALKHGYIEVDVDARDKGRIKKKYRIKIYRGN